MTFSLALENASIPAVAKWCFTTRNVVRGDAVGLTIDFDRVKAGDLILVEATKVGNHRRFQLATGRPSEIYVGDLAVLCVADRYAPDQFEGIAEIDSDGCDLLAGGGVAGRMRHAHMMRKAPTRLKPIGLLTDKDGKVLNLAAYDTLSKAGQPSIPVIIVTGTSMNAGKTTTTVATAYGLQAAGYRAAGIKLTGTGAFGDYNAMLDAGLHYVADFVDGGMASTYRQPVAAIERVFQSLIASASEAGCDVAIVELADGIYQQEAAKLLERSSVVRDAASAYLFASGDAVSTVGGVAHLTKIGCKPIAVSGMVSCSPLAASEAAAKIDMPIASRSELMSAEFAARLFGRVLPEKLFAAEAA